jgi:hypothetical protein
LRSLLVNIRFIALFQRRFPRLEAAKRRPFVEGSSRPSRLQSGSLTG